MPVELSRGFSGKVLNKVSAHLLQKTLKSATFHQVAINISTLKRKDVDEVRWTSECECLHCQTVKLWDVHNGAKCPVTNELIAMTVLQVMKIWYAVKGKSISFVGNDKTNWDNLLLFWPVDAMAMIATLTVSCKRFHKRSVIKWLHFWANRTAKVYQGISLYRLAERPVY